MYIRPSLVWMRQYSPSRVGRMGPPILVEDGYVFYLIAENADAGEAAFHAYVEAQA